jgi:hypothetical protein
VGYARSPLTNEQLREQLRPYIKSPEADKVDAFLALCTYVHGEVGARRGEGAGWGPAACGGRARGQGWPARRPGGGLQPRAVLSTQQPTHPPPSAPPRPTQYAPGSPGYEELAKVCRRHEGPGVSQPVGRLFYLALPPFVYPQVGARRRGGGARVGERGFGARGRGPAMGLFAVAR